MSRETNTQEKEQQNIGHQLPEDASNIEEQLEKIITMSDDDVVAVQNIMRSMPILLNQPLGQIRRTPLMLASKYGQLGIAQYLYSLSGIDINAADIHGTTALMYAASNVQLDVLTFLLALPEMNVNATDSAGWTALMYVAYDNSVSVMRILLEPSTTFLWGTLDVNKSNVKGETALILAARQGWVMATTLLCEAPLLNPFLEDWEGMNALDHSYSAQVNRLDIIRIGEALLDRMNRRSKCLLELARLKDLKGAFESCVQMIPRYSIESYSDLIHPSRETQADHTSVQAKLLCATGESASVCRDRGCSAEMCRDAGYSPSELLSLCHIPSGDRRFEDGDIVPNWQGCEGCPVIAEDKYGKITFVHPKCPEDIRIRYDDGSFNTVNTHDACLATDGYSDGVVPYCVPRGSVRLLKWAESGGDEITQTHGAHETQMLRIHLIYLGNAIKPAWRLILAFYNPFIRL